MRTTIWPTLGAVALVATIASCSSDGGSAGGSTEAPGGTALVGSDAAFAVATCDALRAYDNGLVDIVNDSVAGIESRPSDERAPQLLAGLQAATEAVQAWDDQIDSLDLPDLAEAAELRRQLHQGAAQAVAELDDQAAEWADLPAEIVDDEVQGEVGIWFNAIEKVSSVSEPEIYTFERPEFKQAFLDEPHCRNVIQQFVND